VIELTRVRKAFPPTTEPVLRDVSLQVPARCLYGLIGPGASGKSLVLKAIPGLVTPDAGSVKVDGQEVTTMPAIALSRLRERFGMLFQNNALFEHLTVFENVAFPLRRLYGATARDGEARMTEADIVERVRERLARVALSGFEDRLPAGLSGGQKKRVGVARATVARPKIVLYDEPAAGLDPVTSQKIFELLRGEQRASGCTVVMVSSDLDRLLTVTDRVGMLYRGELIFEGTTEETRASRDARVRQFVQGLTEGPL